MIDYKKLYIEMNQYEDKYHSEGYENIIGIDEVGRGPIAGSVVVAGVILDKEILGLRDSKKLSRKRVIEMADIIKKEAKAYKIVEVRASTIDKIGIKKAVLSSMTKVAKEIDVKPDFALIDFEKPSLPIDSFSMKKGDNVSNSIAAASIIAKDFRDSKMEKLAKKHSEYGFDTHVGYGTKKHIEAIKKHGIIKGVHRESFEPIKSKLNLNQTLLDID